MRLSFLIVLIGRCITCAYCILMLITYCHKFSNSKLLLLRKNKRVSVSPVRYSTYFTVIFFALQSLAYILEDLLTTHTDWFNSFHQKNNHNENYSNNVVQKNNHHGGGGDASIATHTQTKVLGMCQGLAFIGATLAFYALMIQRLYHTFKDTMYETRPRVYALYVLSLCVWTVLTVLFWYYLTFATHTQHQTYAILAFVEVPLNIVIGQSLVFLFCRKLFYLTLSQRQSICVSRTPMVFPHQRNHDRSHGHGRRDGYDGGGGGANKSISEMFDAHWKCIELSERQLLLLTLITKQTILLSMAINVTNVGGFFFAVFYLTAPTNAFSLNGDGGGDHDGGDDDEWQQIYTFLWVYHSCSVCVALFCILLSFQFSEHLYFTLCGKCHGLTHALCQCVTKYCIHTQNQKTTTQSELNFDGDLVVVVKS